MAAPATPMTCARPQPAQRLAVQRVKPWRDRLLILAALVLLAVNLRGAVTAVSPLLAELRSDLGLTTAGAGLLGTLPPFAFGVFGALTPVLIRRIGLERSAWVALLLTTAGQLLRSLVGDSASFLALSLVALGGMGIGNVLLPPLVKKYFPDRLGVVTAGYVVLLCVGTTLPPLVAVPVADLVGWRVSIGQWSLMSAVAVVPWLVLSVRASRSSRSAASSEDSRDGSPARTTLPLQSVLRSRTAWGLGALMGTTSLNTYALLAWLPELLTDAGVDSHRAGLLLAFYAGLGLPTAVLVPWLAVRMRRPVVIVLGCVLLYAMAYLGLALRPASFSLLWVTAAGLAPCGFPLSLALVNLRSRTHAGAATLSGFAQGVGYCVAGVGPIVVGTLRDLSGGWTVPLAFLAATLAVQVTGGVFACRPRFVEDDVRPVPARTGTSLGA
ncbi:MAG: CynX/NimT family MFS transporter [Actinomycetes bacterium]